MFKSLIHPLFKINLACTSCSLAKYRYKMVIGRGTVPGDILFIGESPGEIENITGLPFTGKSGALLDLMIKEAFEMSHKYYNIKHLPTYFITNTVLCRPCNSFGGANRQPRKSEIAACSLNIEKIIAVVKPKRVMFIGKVAMANYKKRFPKAEFIYHPAYLLRSGGEKHSYYISQVRKLCDLFIQLDKGNK